MPFIHRSVDADDKTGDVLMKTNLRRKRYT